MQSESLGMFELKVLLAVRKLASSAEGQTIVKAINGAFVEQTPKEGAVYITLCRLERKNYVSSSYCAARPIRGGKKRKMYSLTRGGYQVVINALQGIKTLADGLLN